MTHCESKVLPSTTESQMEEKTDKHNNKRQDVYLYGILVVSKSIRMGKIYCPYSFYCKSLMPIDISKSRQGAGLLGDF